MDINYYATHTQYLAPPTEIDWSGPLKKLRADYEKAWDQFDATVVRYHEALALADSAGDLDKQLLIQAIRDGKEDPGTPNQNNANRAVVVADETVTQAHIKLAAATAPFLAGVKAEREALLEQTFNIERERVNLYNTKLEEAQRLAKELEAAAQEMGTTARFFDVNLEQPAELIQFPAPHRRPTIERIDQIAAITGFNTKQNADEPVMEPTA